MTSESDNTLHLRFLAKSDALAMHNLSHLAQNLRSNPWEISEIENFVEQDNNRFLVMETAEHQLVGFAAYTITDSKDFRIVDMQNSHEFSKEVYKQSTFTLGDDTNSFSPKATPKPAFYHMLIQLQSLLDEGKKLDCSFIINHEMQHALAQLPDQSNIVLQSEESYSGWAPTGDEPTIRREDGSIIDWNQTAQKKFGAALAKLQNASGAQWEVMEHRGTRLYKPGKSADENRLFLVTSSQIKNPAAAYRQLYANLGIETPGGVPTRSTHSGRIVLPAAYAQVIINADLPAGSLESSFVPHLKSLRRGPEL